MGIIEYNCKTKKTVYRDLTETEIKEYESLAEVETIPQMPTDAERIEALEMAMLEMLEVMANG